MPKGLTRRGDLFDEVEDIVEQGDVEQQDISYTRNKSKRKPLPKDLPREQVVHDMSESGKHYP